MASTIIDRLISKIEIDPSTRCWKWTGCICKDGYGQIKMIPNMRRAHRVSYEVFVGPIPEGLQIDHLCRCRSCINPEHLEPVTPKENIRRSPIAPASLNAMMTHCTNGHKFTQENLVPGIKQRRCKICSNEQAKLNQRKYRREKRGEWFGKRMPKHMRLQSNG